MAYNNTLGYCLDVSGGNCIQIDIIIFALIRKKIVLKAFQKKRAEGAFLSRNFSRGQFVEGHTTNLFSINHCCIWFFRIRRSLARGSVSKMAKKAWHSVDNPSEAGL